MQKQLVEALSHCLLQSHLFIAVHLLSGGYIVLTHGAGYIDVGNPGFPIDRAAILGWVNHRLALNPSLTRSASSHLIRIATTMSNSSTFRPSGATTQIMAVDMGIGELEPESRRFVVISSSPSASRVLFEKEKA